MWRPLLVFLPGLLLAACGSSQSEPDLPAPADARVDTPPAAGDRQVAVDRATPDRVFVWPDLPADRPLKELEGLQDAALRDALFDLCKNHTSLSYTKAKEAIFVPSAGGIDVHGGLIECIYTGRTTAATGSVDPDGFNVEHSWPQSEGAGSAPAEGDLNHLFPSDASANSRRSSLPFGDVACGGSGPPCKWEVGGSRIGPSLTSGATVFEVRRERRGDIARAHFYFAVRYKMSIPGEEEAALRGWNALDPPDSLERDRATAIESIQKKRNPFVDRPDFVQHISDF